MSLITLGLFLIMNRDGNTALIAFALAGGILAFLYFNFNPAKIFMGDTGSLVLGFVVSVLCIRLLQVNETALAPALPNAPVFITGVAMIPVFDTLGVFLGRMWKGNSPFSPDKTHIHHLLTNQGYTHGFASKLICFIHGFILIEIYFLRNMRMEFQLLLLFGFMFFVTVMLKRLGKLLGKNEKVHEVIKEYLG